MKKTKTLFIILMLGVIVSGCRTVKGNVGEMPSYPFPAREAQFILNGEPIEFEGEFWFPADDTESLLDSEIFLLGEYRGVQFFIEKTDVRPYKRLYTKFGRNKYRYFETRLAK